MFALSGLLAIGFFAIGAWFRREDPPEDSPNLILRSRFHVRVRVYL